jgi:hypothetical protein
MRASVSARWLGLGLGLGLAGQPRPLSSPDPKCLLACLFACLLVCLLASLLAGLLVCCLLAGSGEGHTKARLRAVRRGSDRPQPVCLPAGVAAGEQAVSWRATHTQRNRSTIIIDTR